MNTITQLKLRIIDLEVENTNLKRQLSELTKGFNPPPEAAKPLWLSPVQWKILRLLLLRDGLSYEVLLHRNNKICKTHNSSSVVIHDLRVALMERGLRGHAIKTVRGWGYVMPKEMKGRVWELLGVAGCSTGVQRASTDGRGDGPAY